MNEKEIVDLVAQADAEYEKVLTLPHGTRQVIRRLVDTVENERRHMRALAKWVDVAEDAPSLDIACEVSAALERLATATASAREQLTDVLGANADPDDPTGTTIRLDVALEAVLAALPVLTAVAVPDVRELLHARCDCVPNLGPAHCHLCGNQQGTPVPWAECAAVREAIADDKNGARQ